MSQYRILLNPEPGGEGTPGAEEMVSIPRSEFEALRAASERSDRPTTPADDREPGPRPSEAAFAEELAARDRKAAEWETAFKTTLREKELATALSGRSLVQGAASQLVKLWRDDLEVIDEDGRFRVLSRDGRPIEEAVSAWLASPEYAHFSRPSSKGGTTTPGDLRSVVGGAAPASPRNLGEAALLRWRETAESAEASPLAPIGLGRRRFRTQRA